MKKLSTCLLLLTLVALSFGQSRIDKPDFSGSWRMTESRNIAGATYSKAVAIVHHDPEIKMSTKLRENGQDRTIDTTYFTDGRGETNRNFGSQIVESKTKWAGNKLEVRHIETTSTPDPRGGTKIIKLEIIEEWALSKDARTITRTVRIKGPPGGTVMNEAGTGAPKEVFTLSE